MFEITIKGEVYQFRFGLGFVREIDKTKTQKAENGTVVNVGLNYAVAALIDKDPLEVVNILAVANKTEQPRVSRALLDEYIEDEDTDFDALCEDILDFFKRGNATRTKTEAILELVEKERAKAAAQTE